TALETGSEGTLALPGRPSGGSSRLTGARQVSWLAAYRRRRLPGGKPSGEDASARRSQSRGRPRIGKKPAAFPFHPHLSRGTVRIFMFQLRRGLSNVGP